VEDERHLIGQIDPSEPAIIQQMRKELRLRHKALTTERAYVGWVGCDSVSSVVLRRIWMISC